VDEAGDQITAGGGLLGEGRDILDRVRFVVIATGHTSFCLLRAEPREEEA
jgi:hypothetical protein